MGDSSTSAGPTAGRIPDAATMMYRRSTAQTPGRSRVITLTLRMPVIALPMVIPLSPCSIHCTTT